MSKDTGLAHTSISNKHCLVVLKAWTSVDGPVKALVSTSYPTRATSASLCHLRHSPVSLLEIAARALPAKSDGLFACLSSMN